MQVQFLLPQPNPNFMLALIWIKHEQFVLCAAGELHSRVKRLIPMLCVGFVVLTQYIPNLENTTMVRLSQGTVVDTYYIS